MCLLSQKQGIEDKERDDADLFTPAINKWGIAAFMKWHDLIDSEKGYILDDTIEFKALINETALSPNHIFQVDTDKKLEELLSKYVEKNMENSKEQISSEIEEKEQQISSQETLELDDTTCGICMEKYSDIIELKRIPRILSGCPTNCKHTICESCAEKLMKNGYIECPFDLFITEVPDGNVRYLTKNGYLLDLLEKDTFINKQEITHDVEYCDDDKTHIATKYCLECQANYCSSCWQLTHSRPSLSKHRHVPIHERIQIVRCPEHINNNVELYCIEEGCEGQRIMCPSCYLYGTHKGHKHEVFEKKLKSVQESWEKNMNFVETTMKTLEKEKRMIDRFHEMLQEHEQTVEENTKLILDDLVKKRIEDVHRQKTENNQKRSEEKKNLYRTIELFEMKMNNLKNELLIRKKSDISTFLESSMNNQIYMTELNDVLRSFSPTTIPLFYPEKILKIANDFEVYTRIVICSLFQKILFQDKPVRKMFGDVFQKNTEVILNFQNDSSLRKYHEKTVELNSNFYGLGKNQFDSVIILVSREEFEEKRKIIYAFTKNLSNYIVAVLKTGTSEEIDFGTMNGALFDLTEKDAWSIIQKLL